MGLPLRLVHKVLAERKQRLDVMRLRRIVSGNEFLDNVMKAQLQPRMLAERAERIGLRRLGIEDGEYVRDLGIAMVDQLVDAADRNLEGGVNGIFTHCSASCATTHDTIRDRRQS